MRVRDRAPAARHRERVPAEHRDHAVGRGGAYGTYALGAWLTPGTSPAARRFAARSSAGSLALGIAGQVIYHLLAAWHATRAPWPVVVLVACLPVATLGTAAALTHLLRAGHDDQAADTGTAGVLSTDIPAMTADPAPAIEPAPAARPVRRAPRKTTGTARPAVYRRLTLPRPGRGPRIPSQESRPGPSLGGTPAMATPFTPAHPDDSDPRPDDGPGADVVPPGHRPHSPARAGHRPGHHRRTGCPRRPARPGRAGGLAG